MQGFNGSSSLQETSNQTGSVNINTGNIHEEESDGEPPFSVHVDINLEENVHRITLFADSDPF